MLSRRVRYGQSKSGALSIHAYDQRETLLGQGTIGLEIEEQSPEIDTLLVAVGGGGLIAGIAAWFGGTVKVVGVEPETSPTLSMALKAGGPVDAPAGGIAADSLHLMVDHTVKRAVRGPFFNMIVLRWRGLAQ
jgi:threonine dehydratase